MGTCLKFVRVNDINLIPRYLFEQVKPLDFDIDELYKWAPVLMNNPMNVIGAFVDKFETVKGVMLCSYNPINRTITVNMLSVDPEYFGMGIVKEADGIVNKFKKKLGAQRIVIVTTRPMAIARAGYKVASTVMMEK